MPDKSCHVNKEEDEKTHKENLTVQICPFAASFRGLPNKAFLIFYEAHNFNLSSIAPRWITSQGWRDVKFNSKSWNFSGSPLGVVRKQAQFAAVISENTFFNGRLTSF